MSDRLATVFAILVFHVSLPTIFIEHFFMFNNIFLMMENFHGIGHAFFDLQSSVMQFLGM